MTAQSFPKDLLALTADAQMERTVSILLRHRRRALGIGDIAADVVRHPKRDPGCRANAGLLLNPRRNAYRKAMVIFDFDGCGERRRTAIELELALEQEFAGVGWEPDQVAFLVIEPELEAWLFGGADAHLQRAVDWPQDIAIRDWLQAQGHWNPGDGKPANPKAAIQAVLAQSRIPLSSEVFEAVARRAGLAHCQDRAFQKFRSTLRRWFPPA